MRTLEMNRVLIKEAPESILLLSSCEETATMRNHHLRKWSLAGTDVTSTPQPLIL
jgi:hypothetical protein